MRAIWNGGPPSRRVLVWLLVTAAVSLALAATPLFGSLGIELSLVVSLVSAFATADIAGAVVLSARSQGGLWGRPAVALARAWWRGTLRGWALLLVPLSVSFFNMWRVPPCDPWPGLALFFALPVLGAPFAALAGVLGRVWVRGKKGAWAAPAFIVASWLWGLWQFHSGPAIFAYDPFLGYFPGSIYDEAISLTAPFVWSRVLQAAWAGTLFAVTAACFRPASVSVGVPRASGLVRAVLPLVCGVVLCANAGRLGVAPSPEDLGEALGARLETEHFVIHFPIGASFAPLMPRIAQEHEFRYAQLVERTGVEPAGKIRSYYFATAEEKGRAMGARHVHVAKPWRREIYLTHASFPHYPLRHEIAHVFGSALGDPIFGVALRWTPWPRIAPGLIEGFAVAADWPESRPSSVTPHQAARALLELERLPHASRLLGSGFLALPASLAYTAAGSFTRFLWDLDPAALRRLYGNGGDLLAAFGRTPQDLDAAWRAFLRTQAIEPTDLELARERFRKGSLFQRPCPHVIAKRQETIEQAVAERRWDDALAEAERTCRDDPGEPDHRITQAQLLDLAERPDEAAAVLAALEADASLTVALRGEVLTALADVLASLGRTADAAAATTRAMALPLPENFRRQVVVRALAYADAGSLPLSRYLLSPRLDRNNPLGSLLRAQEVAADPSTSALGQYLVGRVLSGHGAWADAAAALNRATVAGLSDPLLSREALRFLAVAAFLSDDLATAQWAATQMTKADQPVSVRLWGEDWLERLAFAATYPTRTANDHPPG